MSNTSFKITNKSLKNLPTVLKELRNRKEISQTVIGKKIGMIQANVSQLEKVPPKGRYLHHLIKYLNATDHVLVIVPINGQEDRENEKLNLKTVSPKSSS